MSKTENWEQVKEIFASAVDVEPDVRDAFVAKCCDGDDALKAEVDSWLAAYCNSESFIDTPLFSTEKLFAGNSPAEGRKFGNYTILREIGHGGMGAVFLAERNDGEFEQQVALKIVRQSISENQIIERFRSERQILASLNHPNIAKLLDGGVSDADEPFIAMEFIEGEPITDYVRRSEMPLKDTLRLFLKVCSAVSYAHRNLIVHRDIKPGNILVTTDGDPKLLDFGLAKLVDHDLSSGATHTRTVFQALTPAYASPEQLRNDPITTASDTYSLGIVLYELLAGERPFRFDGKSLDQIIVTVTDREPTAPSGVADATSGLKGDLDNIILMALRKEPERRYASVAAFAHDIENYLKGLPVSARPNTFRYRSGKFIKRHRLGVAAAAVVLASLLGGIAISLWQVRQTQLEKAKSDAVSSFLQVMLSASSPGNRLHTDGKELTVKDVLDDASRRLSEADLSGQPEVKAELQRIVATSYLSLGQYDLAESNLNAALDTDTRLYGRDNLETIKTMVLMGELWVFRGMYEKADEFYRQSLPGLRKEQKRGTIDTEYLVTALGDFALLRRGMGDSKEAESILRELLALPHGDSREEQGALGLQQAVLALTLADQGKFGEAEDMLAKKLQLVRQQENTESPTLAGVLTGFGSFQMEQGKLADAKQNFQEAETIYRKVFNQANLQLGDNLRLQAHVYFLENDYAEAEVKINEALKIYQAATSKQYVNYPTALIEQGLIYGRIGRATEAEALLREALKLRAENLPPTHFLLALASGALGQLLAEQSRFNEAEPLLISSYESLKTTQSPDSPRTARAARELSELYKRWNKPELAEKYLR